MGKLLLALSAGLLVTHNPIPAALSAACTLGGFAYFWQRSVRTALCVVHRDPCSGCYRGVE
jgi:hypothetical protein